MIPVRMARIRTSNIPFVSRWQSALVDVLTAEATPENMATAHPAMRGTCEASDQLFDSSHPPAHEPTDHLPDRDVSEIALAKECATLYLSLLTAKITGDSEKEREIENEIKFSVCDPMWAKVLLEYRRGGGDTASIPYRRYTNINDNVIALPDLPEVRVLLLSDWATGTELAQHVLRCGAQHDPHVFIHLGDVYYSGTRREMEENFLQPVQAILPETTAVYALAGNHDLYAGGQGYYWLLDQLGQPASYFCLRNAHWQIQAIGGSPASEDPTEAASKVPEIDKLELSWQRHKLDTAAQRKTVMLSHYQLFTASGSIAKNEDKQPMALNQGLYDGFKSTLNQIDLWLWGHEHNMIAFAPYLGLERGRCIGSGAIPVPLGWEPYTPDNDLVRPHDTADLPTIEPSPRLGHDDTHYHHGYAVLTLRGAAGHITYYEVAGTNGESRELFRESL